MPEVSWQVGRGAGCSMMTLPGMDRMTWGFDRGLSSPTELALTCPHGGHRGLKEEAVVHRTFRSRTSTLFLLLHSTEQRKSQSHPGFKGFGIRICLFMGRMPKSYCKGHGYMEENN